MFIVLCLSGLDTVYSTQLHTVAEVKKVKKKKNEIKTLMNTWIIVFGSLCFV